MVPNYWILVSKGRCVARGGTGEYPPYFKLLRVRAPKRVGAKKRKGEKRGEKGERGKRKRKKRKKEGKRERKNGKEENKNRFCALTYKEEKNTIFAPPPTKKK